MTSFISKWKGYDTVVNLSETYPYRLKAVSAAKDASNKLNINKQVGYYDF